MIIIKDVSKQYGSFSVLNNINLEFINGVYGLLAPNGAGKTTLIKMLATLISPSKGEILYCGENILDMDEGYRTLLGYLPQQFGYYKNYSPKQYLLYLAALKGIGKKEAVNIITELLDKVALSDVMNKKMKKFSGGMIQRVGIAQALLNDPKILILDEPTAGLDPKERARFRHLLSELARDRLVIISTHIVSDIESIANEVIMIKNQQILYKDSVEKICASLEGQVYEASIRYEQLDEFRTRYVVLSEKQERGNMRVRFIHKEKPETEWQPVTPHLEDVFLYEYRDEIEVEV
ncbi:ABC transporter ATP-binding protein [Aneurinibacillus aneurinilyticus]|uniref:ABC transporter, ATP-binding protein n=1 Tax=Aneurinibacillus aneurinilyticus ATCC 12856 TaxID=649747 RepID=U1Y5I8_ANEAE|nr:ABC transporter ATP-binding protein [Aneurinibacillus aneurinilyticus]ERI07432.1 ABC transporter, ATP-binding protein [Aneurinibacillus aneurinilyticus ATCC 12856]MED0708992.1 ABC transporter ATP-binding protein [Aneurinibacillus aneurinilyticus]MED0723046.1 ABC transporter ATP-binding protein [Aneurinibacillus aneurinilyticus]MED0739916.1 ABC transporter ATP-binding protein [Aneurinibacillus aneurinilyticus]